MVAHGDGVSAATWYDPSTLTPMERGGGLIGPSFDRWLTTPPEDQPGAPADELEMPTPDTPSVGDLVRWHDGTLGQIASTDAPWLEPGEVHAYRDFRHPTIGAPTWMLEAGTLAPSGPEPVVIDGDERTVYVWTYTGSLRSTNPQGDHHR